MTARLHTVAITLTAVMLTACAGTGMSPMYSQESLPSVVQVPAGNRVAMQTIGKGDIRYECRAKKDAPDQFEWTFVGPNAILSDRNHMTVGKYFGPPATWVSNDGSKVTATQVAVAPGGAGNIPLQLVKANPGSAGGTLEGVTYIQRVATMGGVAPASVCGAANIGAKETVKYQAEYIFWKAV